MRFPAVVSFRHVILLRAILAGLLTAAAVPAAAQNIEFAKLGVGHEIYLTFRPEQLAAGDKKMEIDYINKGVVQADVVSKTRLRMVAQKKGRCSVRIKTADGIAKTYVINVLDPRDKAFDKDKRRKMELGVGHDRMLPLPEDFAKGDGAPVVTAGNPDVLRFDIINKHVRLIGRESGITDLSLLTADDELRQYRVTVLPAGQPVAGDPGKNPLQLAVGHSRMLKLPGSLVNERGKQTPLSATADPRVATVNIVSPELMYVIAKGEGVSDLTFMTSDGRLFLYRTTVLPPGSRVENEPRKELLRLTAGKNHDLLLPLGFVEGNSQTMIAAADPEVLGFQVASAKKLVLEPKAPGTSDLTMMDAKGKLHLYRAIVAPDPKRDPLGGNLKLAVGQEEFVLFERGLVRAQTLVKIKVDDSEIADVRMLTPRRVRIVGMQQGRTTATLNLVDGRTIQYHLHVVRPRDLAVAPERREMKLALGTSRVIDMPANFTAGELRTTITVGDPQTALFSVFNERYLYVVAKTEGATDLSLLSASDELYQYRVQVLPQGTKVSGEPAKTRIEMTAGSNKTIDLPADFTEGKGQSTIATANPGVLTYKVLNATQLRLDAKRPGISDLTLLSAAGELTRYRVKVAK